MQDNQLLARLPPEERRFLHEQVTVVTLERGKWLAEHGEVMKHVYFPISGAYSVLGTTAVGQVEIGSIGNEGFVGIPAFLDDAVGVIEVVVLVGGIAAQIDVARFQVLARDLPGLRTRLYRYTQAFISLTVQSGACNALHTVEQRCARWLLMTQDRVSADRFPLTQDLLARMLGVRRPTVTLATLPLKEVGAVRFQHGEVVILNRAILQGRACDCYAIVVDEFERLLGPAGDTGSDPLPLSSSV